MEFYNEIGVYAQRIYDRVIDACDAYDEKANAKGIKEITPGI